MNAKLCQFYSPNWLSKSLIEALAGLSPASIVDLGSGPGSLSDAAALEWPDARISTVDVDFTVAASRPSADSRFSHVCRNVLADGLARAVGVEPKTVDLVISNPPYTRVKRNRSIDRVLARAGLSDAISGWSMVPVDLAFLAQALLLARAGGTVAFVVPDTLISSEMMEPTRRLLISQHRIDAVVQLPRRTFGRTDALAFIIVIRKSAERKPILLSAVDDTGRLGTKLEISAKEGIRRLDCMFHASNAPASDRVSLAELGAVVSRGRSDSRRVVSANGTIFHTSDFPRHPGGGVSLGAAGDGSMTSGVIAQVGDILLARVDRHLERKVAVVEKGAAEISDCVLRLRVPEMARERVLHGLASDDGQRQIAATARGTGARHISQKAVLSIRV